MALAMPSRFAVLKIEDDDFRPANPNKSKDKKKADKQGGKKNEKQGTTGKKTAKQPNAKPQQKKEKKKRETADQWEQWKQKDSELVDGHYEQDLHTAILESKLDYEEKKVLYQQHKKEAEQEKKPVSTASNCKKKKNKAMSLEQFKNLVSEEQDSTKSKGAGDSDISAEYVECDDQFFDRIQTETKQELTKEFTGKQISEVKTPRKTFNNDTITIAQLQEKLEATQSENKTLRKELEKAKKETQTVKERNKNLCVILASGEMKDKADVLMELEKLNRIREELTEEVTRLHGLLEQERSKVGVLTAEPHTHTHNHNHNKGHKEKHRKKGKE